MLAIIDPTPITNSAWGAHHQPSTSLLIMPRLTSSILGRSVNFYDFNILIVDFTFNDVIHFYFVYINYTWRFSHEQQPRWLGRGALEKQSTWWDKLCMAPMSEGLKAPRWPSMTALSTKLLRLHRRRRIHKKKPPKAQSHVKDQVSEGKIMKVLAMVASKDNWRWKYPISIFVWIWVMCVLFSSCPFFPQVFWDGVF